jgi:hypothetical protein
MLTGNRTSGSLDSDWGFYGHRLITELAIYTLPTPLIGFYKKNRQYLIDHSVDPDKRRHASEFEAIRHYIDIDHWGEYPYTEVPREFELAIIKYADFVMINGEKIDTLKKSIDQDHITLELDDVIILKNELDSFIKMFQNDFMPHYYDQEWIVDGVQLDFIKDKVQIKIVDHFSEYGILPYNLNTMYYRLQKAMREKNNQLILRLSADFGHYIGDGHVPLHTTENYNGQLTGQEGIHAFWESRIPELFAENEYDFFVGKAEYVEDVGSFAWDFVLTSNQLVDSVLTVEKKLRNTFPEDQQYCYDDRNGLTIRQPCPEFAKAYQNAMGDLVESRMRAAIKAMGDLWYSAWIEAGQPVLDGNFTPLEIKPLSDSLPLSSGHAERISQSNSN